MQSPRTWALHRAYDGVVGRHRVQRGQGQLEQLLTGNSRQVSFLRRWIQIGQTEDARDDSGRCATVEVVIVVEGICRRYCDGEGENRMGVKSDMRVERKQGETCGMRCVLDDALRALSGRISIAVLIEWSCLLTAPETELGPHLVLSLRRPRTGSNRRKSSLLLRLGT